MCGIAEMHEIWGERAAKLYSPGFPCPAERLPSVSTQSGVREGFITGPYPPLLFFIETERLQFSTLVPLLLQMLYSQSHKNLQRRENNADTLTSQPSTFPPASKVCSSLGASPKAWPPLQCMRSPLSSAQRCCFICPGHILYIYFLLQSLSLEKLYITPIFKLSVYI